MKTNDDTDRRRDITAIEIWENEGGAPGDSADHLYGRRVEADRSWTVYHVFSGAPARVGGDTMTGLSQRAATSGMLSLNLRNLERRNGRIGLPSVAESVPETAKCQS